MKWWKGFLLLSSIAMIGVAPYFSITYSGTKTAQLANDWTTHTLIAHELGGVGNDTLINSVDTFNHYYQKGFRVFETDLTLTSDNQLVANHDWSGYKIPPTYAEFMEKKILGKYTPTDAQMIINLLIKHPDIFLVTDTKETDPNFIRKQFTQLVQIAKQKDPSVLNRIIPEIYTPEMYDEVCSIYPFKNKYYSIYQLGDTSDDRRSVINFMLQHDIKTLTMPVERLDNDYMQLIKENNLTLYVFTVNSVQEVTKLKKMGVHGVYTDVLTPDDPALTQALAQTSSNPTMAASSKNKSPLSFYKSLTSFIQAVHKKLITFL